MSRTGPAEEATSLRSRLALSESIRRHALRMLSVQPGAERAAYMQSVRELGELIGAHSAAWWDVDKAAGAAVRQYRWERPGVDRPPLPAPIVRADTNLAELFGQITEPFMVAELSPDAVPDMPEVVDLCALLVPGLSKESMACLLVFTRPTCRPFEDWEQEMLSEVAQLMPVTRDRLDREAQVVASFVEAPVGITLRSADGAMRDCNRAFYEFLGFESKYALIGTTLRQVMAVEELTEDLEAALVDRAIQSRRGLEVPFRHRDGSTVWGRMAVAPIQTHHGHTWLTHVEDITELHRRQLLTRKRATRDALTDLANRHEIVDRLEEYLSADRAEPRDGRAPCAVVLLDLNRFKLVNDRHGHRAGDHVLTEVGKRLRSQVRPSDLVGRYGGDEFLVILGGPIRDVDAQRRAHELYHCLLAPFDYEGTELRIGASAGTALGQPGELPVDLIAQADIAMYNSKQARRAAEWRNAAARRDTAGSTSLQQ